MRHCFHPCQYFSLDTCVESSGFHYLNVLLNLHICCFLNRLSFFDYKLIYPRSNERETALKASELKVDKLIEKYDLSRKLKQTDTIPNSITKSDLYHLTYV